MDEEIARQKAHRKRRCSGDQDLNSKNPEVISMCEVLERRIVTHNLPYDLEEPGDEREITRGLMKLSQQALSKYVDKEPDSY